jgi:hypothetical protein
VPPPPVPADDVLRAYLNALGLTASPSNPNPPAGGWPAITGTLPPEGADEFVAIAQTGGVYQGKTHNDGERIVKPTVVLSLRSAAYPDGMAKGRAIEAAMDKVGLPVADGGVGKPVVAVGTDSYILDAVLVTIPTMKIGQEEANRRDLFTLNLMLSVRRL